MTLDALRHRPLVFVDDLDVPVLLDGDHHHLSRALRCRPGDPITVSDGAGRWREATLGAGPGPGELGPVNDANDERRGRRPLTVGFAVVKGDRSELAVQKLTELGIDRIIPMTTERTVVRWDDAKSFRNHERHLRVAREAAMQSRNLWLPEVWPLTPLKDVIGQVPDAVLAEPGGAPLEQCLEGTAGPESGPPLTVLVGPEGGFSADECEGRRLVGLPGNILRTESAAICAGVLLVLNAERG